jgi:type IV pilus assembly protein PilX
MKYLSKRSNIMNSLPMHNKAGFPEDLVHAFGGNSNPKQRGVVLFLTLIALLAMSLAAVALIRSVDTSSMILGNLAFKASVKTSADAGFQGMTNQLTALQNAYVSATGLQIENDPNHPLSLTNLGANPGYYSNFNPALLDTPPLLYRNPAAWGAANGSVVVGPDSSGNTMRYIIQRMCRYANEKMGTADCLYGAPVPNLNPQEIQDATQTCKGCPQPGQPAQVRVTVQATSTTGAVSYIQGFIY